MPVSPDALLGVLATFSLAAAGALWKLATMLAEVRSQVRHNGGSSLKDDARTAAVEAIRARELAESVANDLVLFRGHQADDTAETRQAVAKVQHDVTNIRAGQEMLLQQQLVTDERVTNHRDRNIEHVLELRRSLAEYARESASRDKALGQALKEQLDVTLAVSDGEPPPDCD